MKLAEDLKKAVLQAAMQGKLTKQLETDSSVDELLKKIADEKAKLIEEGKIRKEKPLSDINNNEIPFDIPDSWKWMQLGKIVTIRGGKRIPAGLSATTEDTGHIYIRVSDMQNGTILDNDLHFISESIFNGIKNYIISKDDVYITVAGTIGRVGLVPEKFHNMNLTENADRLTPYFINKEYLYRVLSSEPIQTQIREKTKKVGQPKLAIERLSELLLPLPPIEEQQRIVDKLNQILPLIDEYGKEEDELITLCQKFPEEMKKSVLQSAMQGKLTEQQESDSSVDELLKKIADEKAKLIAKGKIKKEKPISEITEEEIPFDIPDNWRWTRLRSIVYSRGQKTPDKKFSYIDIGSINNQKQTLSEKENIIDAKDAPCRARKIVAKNDVIYSTVRPYLHNMCIIDKDFSEEPIASTGFAVMTCIKVLPEFLLKYLLSPDFDAYANDHENSKGVAYPAINDDRLYKALIPIPPVEEQQRIVEKLNAILPIIDSMAVYGTKKKVGRQKQEEALAFIRSFLGTQKSSDSKPLSPEITELKAKAKEELPAIVKKYASLMGVNYNRITIRHQKTRWGSCTKTGNLSFNCLLMKMPETVRDYVIVHELAHRKELNHSTKFWTIVAEYCPWYKDSKQWLKENGKGLMEL